VSPPGLASHGHPSEARRTARMDGGTGGCLRPYRESIVPAFQATDVAARPS
jgi:hypothetical protein